MSVVLYVFLYFPMCYRMLSVSVVTTRTKDLITVYVKKNLNFYVIYTQRETL